MGIYSILSTRGVLKIYQENLFMSRRASSFFFFLNRRRSRVRVWEVLIAIEQVSERLNPDNIIE